MKAFLSFFSLLMLVVLLASCRQQQRALSESQQESKEAKELMQGIWIDTETEEVVFRVKGDTIYYPDTLSLPAYFRIVGDTIEIGPNHYFIQKQAAHLFWFNNQANDVVKLRKSDDPNDVLAFAHKQGQPLQPLKEVQKTDSVVVFNGERYHWYIAINPTRFRVTKASYSNEGVEVENVYYDNIIHISIYQGSKRLFSSDIKKQNYEAQIPESFLSQSVLGNMEFDRVDGGGFHFNATLCIPDGGTCYLVSTDIGFDGPLEMKLLE